MAYPGYQPPNRTNVGPPSKSKDQIARELDVARGRREFFSDRPDVSDDRALRRMKQFDEMRSFKNKLMDSGRVLKGVRPDGTEYIVKNTNTGEPVYLGTTPKFDTNSSSPTFGRYTSTSVADKGKQLANLYGPTFKEIGSDIGYGLGNIAKGFAEKGTPLISLIKSLYGKGKDFVTQGIPSALRGESQGIETVPRRDPFSSGADAVGGAYVSPTLNNQKIESQDLNSILPPSKMSNEQFDEEFPFLPERTVNLDNPLFKQQNFQPIRVSDMDMTGVTAQEGDRPVLPENVIPMMRVGEPMNIDQYKTPVLPPEVTDPRMYQGQTLYAQNFGLPSLKQSYDFLRKPQVETPLGNLRFDNFLSGNPQLGYGNTVMINGVPVDLSATIGQDQISGGLSFAFKKGGSVDKHSGLGYKLK